MRQSVILILLACIVISCTTRKHLVYLDEIDRRSDSVTTTPISQNVYRLKVGDILYVKITSVHRDMNSIFNTNDLLQNANGQNINQALTYLNGYTISDDGTLTLPVLEKISVKGLTIDEAQQAIQTKADEFLKQTTVEVKLLSFSINILGEVNSPGTKDIYQKNLNIFEALARAGDIKETGDKKNILLIRVENGEAITYRIDLTKKTLFSQVGYEIKPDDILIVQPLRLQTFRMNIPTYSILLTAVSAILLATNFIIFNR